MKRVYLCSPYNGGNNDDLKAIVPYGIPLLRERRARNSMYAMRLMMRMMKEKEAAVFAPHLLYTAVLDEDKRLERRLGLDAGLAYLETCDVLVVCDRYGVSEGMKLEVEYAQKCGVEVVNVDSYLSAEHVGKTIR
jgi:hypothetical protein